MKHGISVSYETTTDARTLDQAAFQYNIADLIKHGFPVVFELADGNSELRFTESDEFELWFAGFESHGWKIITNVAEDIFVSQEVTPAADLMNGSIKDFMQQHHGKSLTAKGLKNLSVIAAHFINETHLLSNSDKKAATTSIVSHLQGNTNEKDLFRN